MACRTSKRCGRNLSDAGGDGCLICGEAFNVSHRPNEIPLEFGTRPVEAFLKICQVLQLPYTEVENDWNFDSTNGAAELDLIPFCVACFSGFHLIVKLQQQLINIQKQIDEKIAGIREQIRKSQLNSIHLKQEHRVVNFRLKALSNSRIYGFASTSSLSNVPSVENYNDIPSNASPGNTGLVPSSEQSIFISNPVSIPLYPQSDPISFESDLANFKQDYDNNNSDYGDDDAAVEAAENDHSNVSSDAESEADDDKISNQTLHKNKREASHHDLNYNKEVLATLFPPAIKIRKPKATANSQSQKLTETFSPIYTQSDGTMVFEGIIIIPEKNGYKCGQCGTCFTKDDTSEPLHKVQVHIKGVHLDAYKCNICQKKSSSIHTLAQHIFRIHECGGFICPTCSKPVKQLQYMKHHQFSHLSAEEKKTALTAGYKRQGTSRKPTVPCPICGKKFDMPSNMKRHEMTHVPAEFRKDFKCQYCDKSFATERGRSGHVFTAHNRADARKTFCRICGEAVLAIDLKSHQVNKHLAPKCNICERTFISEKGYRIHIEKCGKPQKRQDDHQFGCDICSKFFATSELMCKHRRTVHKSHWKVKVPTKLAEDISVDNPTELECLDDLNNEGIQHVNENIYSFHLYQVEKLLTDGGESGYRCCTCLEEFYADSPDEMSIESWETLEEKVKTHIRSLHMGSFRCNRCTKRFKTLHDAVTHKNNEHLNRKTFKCDICGRGAISLCGAKEHVWKHKNVWEVAEALNKGECFPPKYSTSKTESLLAIMGIQLNLKCAVCNKEGFNTTEGLYDHRVKKHPNASVRVKLIRQNEPCRKRGRKKGQTVNYPCGRKRKAQDEKFAKNQKNQTSKKDGKIIKRRKVMVLAEEDGSGSEEEVVNYLDSKYFDMVKTRLNVSGRRINLRGINNRRKRLSSKRGSYSKCSELDSDNDSDGDDC